MRTCYKSVVCKVLIWCVCVYACALARQLYACAVSNGPAKFLFTHSSTQQNNADIKYIHTRRTSHDVNGFDVAYGRCIGPIHCILLYILHQQKVNSCIRFSWQLRRVNIVVSLTVCNVYTVHKTSEFCIFGWTSDVVHVDILGVQLYTQIECCCLEVFRQIPCRMYV